MYSVLKQFKKLLITYNPISNFFKNFFRKMKKSAAEKTEGDVQGKVFNLPGVKKVYLKKNVVGENAPSAKKKAPPEKFWQQLVDVYFNFYKAHFRDNDGFRLEPNWSPATRGMESKGLKEILIRLRTIAEQKNFDWTENYAVEQWTLFLNKAYQKSFIAKTMMCCLMNKYKDEIIVSEYNDPLVKKILAHFYFLNSDYAVDEEKDRAAAEIIIGFLKANYLRSNIVFTEKSVLQSTDTIFRFVKNDEFWKKKSLKSISNNLQEFVNKIKANKNVGNINAGTNGKTPVVDIKPKGGFGKL